MANRTAKYAQSVHGTNPQYLIEKIVRERIYDSRYWQEDCFMATSAQVLEKAVDDLKYVGGTYGAKVDPTPFLCLVLKLLQIQPSKEIIYLYIEQSDFKYLRALGAFYLRLVGASKEVFSKLEPVYNDFRKLRLMSTQRTFSVIHMDEFIDNLLRDEKVLNISLPRLTKRTVLEENRELKPYKSELEEQNLIPTQLIAEKIELQRDQERKKRHDYSSEIRRRYDHDEDRSSPRRMDNKRDEYHKYDVKYQSPGNRDRHRSNTTRLPETSSSSHGKASGRGRTRFSQAEIDSENAIRAKVGLKPLK